MLKNNGIQSVDSSSLHKVPAWQCFRAAFLPSALPSRSPATVVAVSTSTPSCCPHPYLPHCFSARLIDGSCCHCRKNPILTFPITAVISTHCAPHQAEQFCSLNVYVFLCISPSWNDPLIPSQIDILASPFQSVLFVPHVLDAT